MNHHPLFQQPVMPQVQPVLPQVQSVTPQMPQNASIPSQGISSALNTVLNMTQPIQGSSQIIAPMINHGLNPASALQGAGMTATIKQFIVLETLPYHDVARRPYVVQHNPEVLNQMERTLAHNNSGIVTPAAIASQTSMILTPAATPVGIVNIANGWSQKRFSWLLELEVFYSVTQSTMIYYMNGYTDYNGIDPVTKSIDPNLLFVINGYSCVCRTQVHDSLGQLHIVDVPRDSGQFLTTDDPNSVRYGMRPVDIYTGIQQNYLRQSTRNRINDNRAVLTIDNPHISNRENNSAPAYLSKLIETWVNGSQMLSIGGGHNDLIGHAINNTIEQSVFENPLMMLLSDIHNNSFANIFSYRDLQMLDPNVFNKMVYTKPDLKYGADYRQHHEHLSGSSHEIRLATKIAAALPALMVKNMLMSCTISSNNRDNVIQPMTVITDMMTFNSVDIREKIPLITWIFNSEIAPDLSLGGHIIYSITVTCYLLGNIRISIGLNGQPEVPIIIPQFADALFAPTIAHDQNHFMNTSNSLEMVFNSCKEAILDSGTTIAINNSI